MTVNDQDVRALEHLAHRIREDTHGCKPWDRPGTVTVFARELKGKHLLTAIELVVAHAQDPDAKTPGSITRNFTPAPAAPRRGDIPPTRAEECPKHPGQFPPPYCGACATESIRAYHDPPTDPQPGDTEAGAQACRALLRGEA